LRLFVHSVFMVADDYDAGFGSNRITNFVVLDDGVPFQYAPNDAVVSTVSWIFCRRRPMTLTPLSPCDMRLTIHPGQDWKGVVPWQGMVGMD
jgi:hypothetical protein